jgi:YidC/Oxa1 family membrane protein insertase
MYIFPLIFAVTGVNFPVGVLVYWLTTNVWTMGQQMFVINQNPTPGSKAQDQYLQRLLKSITSHSQVRSRRKRATVQAIVAKGPDRNDNERKFFMSLAKAGLAAQPDGTVIKSDTAEAEAEAGGAARRQQPKRQPKSKRQAAATPPAHGKDSAAADEPAKTSLQKKDEPQDTQSKPSGKPAAGSARQAKAGQRKGQQRPKHPSKK